MGMWKISSSLLSVGLIWMGLTAGSSLYPAQIYQSGSQTVRRVLEELNANQRSAVLAPHGPLAISVAPRPGALLPKVYSHRGCKQSGPNNLQSHRGC